VIVKAGKIKPMLSPENIKRIRPIVASDKSKAPLIDAQWIKYNKAHKSILDEAMKQGLRGPKLENRIRLIHHHVDQGPIAVIVPNIVHQKFHGLLHVFKNSGKATKVHLPNNPKH
jgi:hypothetical protein